MNERGAEGDQQQHGEDAHNIPVVPPEVCRFLLPEQVFGTSIHWGISERLLRT